MIRMFAYERFLVRRTAKGLFTILLFAALMTGGLPAEAATVTLNFESQALDLDTGVVTGEPKRGEGAEEDVYIAYHADKIPHSVVFLTGNGATIALAQGISFELLTAQDAASLTLSDAAPDVPFIAADTVVIRTTNGAVFKLGNVLETDEAVTFDYEIIYVE